MTNTEMHDKLAGLVAFQCVLVALRGVGSEASEEMLWQTLLAALVEQYGFRRAWYGRWVENGLRPLALAPPDGEQPGIRQAGEIGASPDFERLGLSLPISIDGLIEGQLVLDSDAISGEELREQMCILTSEATAIIAQHRSCLRYEGDLKRARLDAEAANRAKSLLLANMSHELRTPMTGILGFANLLAGTPLSAEQLNYVEPIRSCGTSLLTLINDILDFSKLEAGKVELESLPISVRVIVEKVVGLMAVQAAAKHLHLSFTIAPGTPSVILADPARLRQVLLNLLGNAIKFTGSGAVSLAVSSTPSQDGWYQIEFAVRDTGPGIAPEDQARIFEAFSQVDASISRKYGGTGLGLAISKSLAEQMGGALWAESELGNGATFHFTVVAPVAVEARQPPFPRQSPLRAQSPDLPSLRLLVADDNEVNRKVITALLRRMGYHPASASSGGEVLEQLAREQYDVIFMDMQMPGIDGLEATRRIRRDSPPDRQPHIIALTAAAFPEDRAKCLEAGMDDYVSKPVDSDGLTMVLQRANLGQGVSWVSPKRSKEALIPA
jgi:signal transduction histidine kinase/CheY-like chemotaxis protein